MTFRDLTHPRRRREGLLSLFTNRHILFRVHPPAITDASEVPQCYRMTSRTRRRAGLLFPSNPGRTHEPPSTCGLKIVGKIRMRLTPLLNHYWNVPLYVTSRGLTTSRIPYGERSFELWFDFIQHQLVLDTSDGISKKLPSGAHAGSDFHAKCMTRCSVLPTST